VKLPGSGDRKCGGETVNGAPCQNNEVDGLGACLLHVPDDLLEEAEDITGAKRCRRQFGAPDACRKYAVSDSIPPMCTVHGAGSSITREFSAVRGVENRAAATLQEIMAAHGDRLLNPPGIGSPLDELLELAAEIKAMKEMLRDTVAAMVQRGTLRYAHSKAGEQFRAEILLYERALERYAKLLLDISKLNIDDRLQGIREEQLRMLEQALNMALEASHVGLDGQISARTAFRANIRVIQGELAG
jgi:hypothetical protein